jgi:hypothetical protein
VSLDQYRSSCKEEHLELAKLRIQKVSLEFIVEQFQHKNEGYPKIKDMVKQTAENSLTDHRHLLKIAFLSVIDSCSVSAC